MLSNPTLRYARRFHQLGSMPPVLTVKKSQQALPRTRYSDLKLERPEKQSQSHDQSIQSRRHGASFLFLPSLSFLCREHYPSFISPRINELAAVITEELSMQHWASVFRTEWCKSDVLIPLSNNPVLVKTPTQAVSDVASTPERTDQNVLSLALKY